LRLIFTYCHPAVAKEARLDLKFAIHQGQQINARGQL